MEQVSSLISRITRRAEQISTATVCIQMICSYLPPSFSRWSGKPTDQLSLHTYIFKRGWEIKKGLSLTACLQCLKQMMAQFARWEEVKKKKKEHEYQLNAPFTILWCVFSTNLNRQRNQIIKVYFAVCCTAIFTFVYRMFSRLQTSRLSLYPSPSPILCNTTLTSVSDAA